MVSSLVNGNYDCCSIFLDCVLFFYLSEMEWLGSNLCQGMAL